MSIGKTKKEPLKGPTAPYGGYDEREDTEEKVMQALAFLQVLFLIFKFPKNYVLKKCVSNKLPTNSRKSLTATVDCFIIQTDQWSKMLNRNKSSNIDPGQI